METIASATLSGESDGVNYADTAADGVAIRQPLQAL